MALSEYILTLWCHDIIRISTDAQNSPHGRYHAFLHKTRVTKQLRIESREKK